MGFPPSVNRILRHPFIKKHIQLFLDESSKSRRPTSGKSRHVASESSSRKTSSSSVQSRCSSRESNNSVFEQNSPQPQIILPPEQVIERKAKSNESRVTKPQCDPSPKPVPAKKEPVYVSAPSKPVAVKFVSDGMAELDLHNKEKPTDHHHKADVKLPSYDVECPVPSSKQPDVKSSKINRVTSAESATSSSSEGSTDKQNITPRPLPLLAKEERNESPHRVCDDSDSLKASGESNVSKSSKRTRPSSARERRRREKQRRANQKEDLKKPPLPQIIEPPVMANKENERNSIPVLDLQSKRKESAGEEINQFYTLLHTTLKLSNDEQSPPLTPPDNSGRSPSPLTDENRRVQLSPVQELSESAASTITSDRVKNQEASKNPTYTRNTPHATEIGVKIPAHAQPPTRGISQATLGSTGKLMDRIVALRKDCIHGLGVPLLHRAYELLDEDHDEEQLEKRLVKLLGEVRFKQWAGKIWQLKFCEESIFKHCGSITAY